MAAIEIDDLTKFYGTVRGVEDVTVTVERGEVFGLLGPNGAGKTTTIRTLLGLLTPTSGRATVLGRDVLDERAFVDAKQSIGYLPGEFGFDDDLTGRDILDYQASLKGSERRAELLSRFDVPLDRAFGEYSRGMKQKLAIVNAFMHDPDLVVMDEPTSGLDPLMQERFYELLRSERDAGTAVLLSSHVLGEVERVCDRVGVVKDGRLVAIEDVDDLVARSGRTVRVKLVESPSADEFAFEGVQELSVGDRYEFAYTGSYDRLLAELSAYTILDLEIERASLADVFMRFYGETDV